MNRVGVDIVPLARVRELLADKGGSLLERMMRMDEINECRRADWLDVSALAGRIAAKEAVFKLFLRGDSVLPWTGIKISTAAHSWPEVELEGVAQTYARDSGITGPISVSITHDGDYAIAVAAAISASPGDIPHQLA
ncbi:holo-ACP synthase [Streptomonospora algeriensis]|uniref:Holo-[acyl-carrier-protein] synthase n=1 Tax=Streptomonospora algeriensis TaxID=995084 RepID=A0ABW3B9G2_9ACTN